MISIDLHWSGRRWSWDKGKGSPDEEGWEKVTKDMNKGKGLFVGIMLLYLYSLDGVKYKSGTHLA